MSDFKIKDTAKIRSRLDISQAAVKEREHKLVALLGDNGAMKSADIARELGYATNMGVHGILTNLIKNGLVVRKGFVYHLKGQSPKTVHIGEATAESFFEGESKLHHLRRWIRDHQNEPTTITKMGRGAGYATPAAANTVIATMLDNGILRRYQAPEDYGFEWRYQYVDPKLSGITVTPGKEADPDEPKPTTKKMHKFSGANFTHHAEDSCPVVEVEPEPTPEPEIETPVEDDFQEVKVQDDEPKPERDFASEYETLAPILAHIEKKQEIETAAELTEKYAKEFFWATGSRDIRELVVWLKERKLSGEK